MTTVSNERLTFTEAGAHGNCVISPENGTGPYFTLIVGGSDEEQNALAAKICDAVNGLRVEELEATLSRIDELNTLPPDENGHHWANSDLIRDRLLPCRRRLLWLG